MRFSLTILLIILMLGVSVSLAQDDDPVQHTVQAGENLLRIAEQYGVTVQAIVEANDIKDPNTITVGRVLTIPAEGAAPVATEAATEPAPVATEEATETATQQPVATQAATQPAATTPRTHLVIDGDNLYLIASRYGVTVVSLAELNGITDFNHILIGDRLQIPARTSPLAPQPPVATQPPVTVTPVPVNQAEAVAFAYGVQVHVPEQDAAAVTGRVGELGVTWVNQRIDWKNFESTRGNIDFAALEAIVNPLDSAGLNVLLTVTSAPDWARTSNQEDGPPTNNADYANFVRAVAQHFSGVVDAYEIWSEPNLRREWNGKPLSASGYMDLLKLGYNAVKSVDPSALVISGGLAPTATNDGVTAIDDRVFLRGMYAAGLADFSDAVGAHPGGWANPPDSTCCENNRPAVNAWDDQTAFFFMETLRDYRQIMAENNDSGSFIWATAFGWGSSDGFTGDVRPDVGFVTFTDHDEQAQYVVRAFELGEDLTYVGPMFVSNLNFCEALGADQIECFWGMIGSDGQPRPVFDAVSALTP